METLEAIRENAIDKSVSPWDTPRRESVPSGLCSLLMIRYKVENLFALLRQAANLEAQLADRASILPGGSLLDSQKAELLEILIDGEPNFLSEASELEMLSSPTNSPTVITNFYSRVQESATDYTVSTARAELRVLRENLEFQLESRLFLFVSPDEAEYFHQEAIFGPKVFDVFPDARHDLTEAGNALALSLPNAAVFHLMRVVEHGFRRLARKLQVTLTHKHKRCPIEFADWDKVITGIRNKITAARALSAGTKRQSQLEFYSSCADHCEYMKDIWRNNMAHTRKPCSGAQALAALEQVKGFMQFLANSIA